MTQTAPLTHWLCNHGIISPLSEDTCPNNDCTRIPGMFILVADPVKTKKCTKVKPTHWICEHELITPLTDVLCPYNLCVFTEDEHKTLCDTEITGGVCASLMPTREYDSYLYDNPLFESKVRNYQDGSCSINHSVVVSPDKKTQINGAMCGLIAIYDANPKFIHDTTGSSSPWALFEFLSELGWTFDNGAMLDRDSIGGICEILECRIEVEYEDLSQMCGSNGRLLKLHAVGAHFKNGDQLE